jgi:hypothetical protein
MEGKAHFDLAIALYDPAEHRLIASRFGQDIGVVILSGRSWALWLLGHPDAAIADSERALKDARERYEMDGQTLTDLLREAVIAPAEVKVSELLAKKKENYVDSDWGLAMRAADVRCYARPRQKEAWVNVSHGHSSRAGRAGGGSQDLFRTFL